MTATIRAKSLREKLSDHAPMQALDVRSAAEFATGHVPGAVNIPMEQVEGRMEGLRPGPLVLICESGKRAEIVAGWLAGRREVTLLEGGIRAWRNAGYPLVVCAPCRWTLERQVRLIAGLIVLVATLLSVLINAKWVYLAMLVGAGLTFAGITSICGMAILLGKMPWNSERKSKLERKAIVGRKLLHLIAGGVTKSMYGLRSACQ
jgi:rhodanese-related sulfurtransferase